VESAAVVPTVGGRFSAENVNHTAELQHLAHQRLVFTLYGPLCTFTSVNIKVCYLLRRFLHRKVTQHRDHKRFTLLEVAADWHELMIPQRTMRPSIARFREQLDSRCS